MIANTDEMKRIASEISSLAVDYQTKLSKLYSKFALMPNGTNEWVGNRAEEYVSYVLMDKTDFMAVGDRIKDYAKTIENDAIQLETTISKVRKDEA